MSLQLAASVVIVFLGSFMNLCIAVVLFCLKPSYSQSIHFCIGVNFVYKKTSL